MNDSVRITLVYVNDEGDPVEYAQTVTPEGLAAVLTAVDAHAVDED